MIQEKKKLPFCGDRIKGTGGGNPSIERISDREIYVAPKSGG
jgi:hypothetical protein